MKILFATDSYWPNADGGALFERRLVQGLIKHGHDVNVWAAGPKLRSFEEKDGKSTIYREKSIRLIFNWRYRISFWTLFSGRRIIKQFRPDMIHIHNFAGIGISALLWAKHYKIPVLATNHFMPENFTLNARLPGKRRFSKWLVWHYLVFWHNRASYVTSPTPTAVELLQAHGLKTPAQAVSNGIDTQKFQPRPPKQALRQKYGIKKGPAILYLGRLDGEKRIDVIIKALPQLKHQTAQLIIAGTGKARPELETLTAQLELTDRVHFTGFIDEADKPGLYNLAKLFAISSPAELQSIVLLEAMSSALPVVAVDVAALKELCRDGTNGYLFPEDNSAALAQHIDTLLSDSVKAERFGHASRAIAVKEHSNEATVQTYESLYNRLIKP